LPDAVLDCSHLSSRLASTAGPRPPDCGSPGGRLREAGSRPRGPPGRRGLDDRQRRGERSADRSPGLQAPVTWSCPACLIGKYDGAARL